MSESTGNDSEPKWTCKRGQVGFWTADFKGLTASQKVLRLLVFLAVLPALVTVLVLLASRLTLQLLPKMAAVWIVYSIPLAASVFAWIGLCRHLSDDPDRVPKAAAMAVTTGAILVALAQATYVQFVSDSTLGTSGGVLGLMLLFSFIGFAMGLVTIRLPRWFSVLGLAAATWMLVLSCLFGMAF